MNVIENERTLLGWDSPRSEGAVVEMNLLLEPWLLTALERAASEQNMTTAALVRCLIRDFLYYSDGSLSEP
jgi:hypothetical protein